MRTLACSKPSNSRLVRTLLHAAVLLALPRVADAIRVDYQIDASLLHTNNINLSESDPIDENVLSPQLRFDVRQDGSRALLKAGGSLQYLYYLDSTFPSEWRGEFAGQLNWLVLPDRIDFVFEDYLSRQPLDVLAGFTPGNQQQVNVFVTGPTFYARFNEANRAQIDLRYTNSHAEENKDFDSNRYSAAAQLQRELSDTRLLSATLQTTEIDFDLGGATKDYNRDDGYFGYTQNLASLYIDLDLGYSRLRRDIASDDTSPLFRGKLDWFMSPRSTLSASAYYQFADAAQDLVARSMETADVDTVEKPAIGKLLNPVTVAGPDVYRERRAEAGYLFRGERVNLQVRATDQRIRYVDGLISDQRNRSGLLEIGYRLRPRMELSLVNVLGRREFATPSRSDRDYIHSLALANQVTRHWSWRLELQRRKRDSTSAGQSYGENTASVIVSYRY